MATESQATIHYRVHGDGRPVILVHGLSGSGRWWAKSVGPLATRFRVYVIDLIGFGGSRRAGPFVLGEAAGHLARWMEGLCIERASIVGHSMGGFIAAEMAADFPERVERLVLVGAAALPFERDYVRQAVGLAGGLRFFPVRSLPLLIADACQAGPVTLYRAVRDLLAADIRAKLSLVRAPTLVVWGERDTIVPPELGRRLADHLPGSTFVLVRGAGHSPMWERPDDFNRLVVEFLAADSGTRIASATAA